MFLCSVSFIALSLAPIAKPETLLVGLWSRTQLWDDIEVKERFEFKKDGTVEQQWDLSGVRLGVRPSNYCSKGKYLEMTTWDLDGNHQRTRSRCRVSGNKLTLLDEKGQETVFTRLPAETTPKLSLGGRKLATSIVGKWTGQLENRDIIMEFGNRDITMEFDRDGSFKRDCGGSSGTGTYKVLTEDTVWEQESVGGEFTAAREFKIVVDGDKLTLNDEGIIWKFTRVSR